MLFLKVFFLIVLVAALPVHLENSSPNTGQVMSKRSIWSSILSLFNGGSSDSTVSLSSSSSAIPAAAATAAAPSTAVPVPAATTPINTATVVPTSTAPPPAITSAPTTAAAASNGSGSGWLSKILGFFDSFGQTSSALAATPPATTIAPTISSPIAPTITSAANPNSVNSPAITQTSILSTGTSTTRLNPGFSGLVTVVGAGGTQPVATGTTSGNIPSSLPSSPSNSQIQKVAKYAEMGAGISYSPYTKSGSCKTAQEVYQDITMLSGHTLIRLYSVDCEGISNVLAALSPNQKMFLGVWDISALNSDLPSMARQVLTGSRGWDAVHTVSIGNEVVNSGTNTVAQVASAVASARTWFKQNAPQYSGYIVAVDTLAATMAHQQMCDISDYLAVNCHPYFSGIEASTSGTWLQQQIDSLSSFCGGTKQILITESGWPTAGNTEGQAVPSVNNQLLAVKGLGTVVGKQVMMFTTYNDYWKAPGSWNVEQHWGIYGDPEY